MEQKYTHFVRHLNFPSAFGIISPSIKQTRMTEKVGHGGKKRGDIYEKQRESLRLLLIHILSYCHDLLVVVCFSMSGIPNESNQLVFI